jgi:hypothetical protein
LSCTSNNCPSLDTKGYPKNINVNYLISDKEKLGSKNDFLNYLENNKKVLYPFYEIEDTFNLDFKVNNIYSLVDNVYFDSLYRDVQDEFKNKKNLFLKLDHSIGVYNTTSKKQLNPQVTVLLSGFYNDVVVDKENIVLGIEYFLNKDNKYKPRDLPSYILERYTPVHMNSTMLSTYLSQFNIVDETDKTMLNEMISFGKLYYVVEQLLMCESENIVLGYTKEEYDMIEENEAFIYTFFLQNELFFQESQLIKQKYLSERPSTFEISQSVPGRIGRWMGWKIVTSYMREKAYTLEDILLEDDYKKIFYNSNYKPL